MGVARNWTLRFGLLARRIDQREAAVPSLLPTRRADGSLASDRAVHAIQP